MKAAPPSLSAKVKGSFAYNTVKDRLPVILTKVVDTAHRQRHEIIASYGQEGGEDVKKAVGELSELRYRMQTDKPLLPISGIRTDIAAWNNHLEEVKAKEDQDPSWFKSAWLFVECYLYRCIASVFERSAHLQNWDPFQFQKEQAFVSSLDAMTVVAACVNQYEADCSDDGIPKCDRLRSALANLIRLSLWANRCDLSISSGDQNSHSLDRVCDLEPKIVVNEIEKVVSALMTETTQPEPITIDIVLDNAGLELFADLCLADVLLTAGLAQRVRFHAKMMPWFVSDSTSHDFSWTLEMLRSSDRKILNSFGHKFHSRLADGSFILKMDYFWTTGWSYNEMPIVAPELYAMLADSKLTILKGDLNYRKLTGDLDWDPTVSFAYSLRNFKPSVLVALRTIKAEVVTGMQEGLVKDLEALNPSALKSWMWTGEYGVIQGLFAD